MLKSAWWGCRTKTTPMKPIAAPTHVAVAARWRNTTHAITGIHSGALNVSRIALVSGIIVMATNSAYQAAVPVAARRICKPILSVRREAQPRWRVIGTKIRRQIKFWNSSTTAVDVSSSVAFTRALITAVQKKDNELKAAPNARVSGI